MNRMEMTSSGAGNTHMTGIESSIAIKELDESRIEMIENVKDAKFQQILCQLTEVKQLKLVGSKKEREIETMKYESHELQNRVLKSKRQFSKDSLMRNMLSKYRHPLKGKPVFIRERLQYYDADIKKAADNMNLITTTQNCQVKVLVNPKNQKVYSRINDLKQLELAKNQAVIKRQHIRGSNDFRRENSKRVFSSIFPQFEVNNPTKLPNGKTWNKTGSELNYNEVQTLHSSNEVPNKHLINFWSNKNQN